MAAFTTMCFQISETINTGMVGITGGPSGKEIGEWVAVERKKKKKMTFLNSPGKRKSPTRTRARNESNGVHEEIEEPGKKTGLSSRKNI